MVRGTYLYILFWNKLTDRSVQTLTIGNYTRCISGYDSYNFFELHHHINNSMTSCSKGSLISTHHGLLLLLHKWFDLLWMLWNNPSIHQKWSHVFWYECSKEHTNNCSHGRLDLVWIPEHSHLAKNATPFWQMYLSIPYTGKATINPRYCISVSIMKSQNPREANSSTKLLKSNLLKALIY